MDSDKRSSPEQWRLEDILKYRDVDDEHEAEEILHSIYFNVYGDFDLEWKRINRLQRT
jgi:hypothetical protein